MVLVWPKGVIPDVAVAKGAPNDVAVVAAGAAVLAAAGATVEAVDVVVAPNPASVGSVEAVVVVAA